MPSLFGILPIFRGPFLERIGHGTHHSTIRELGDFFSSLSPPSVNEPLRNWFEFFYSLLLHQYQCEYVYKNAIATELYLSLRHSLHDSLLTSEFRSGNSRADVVIINGTSTVYEVKSGYDSLRRLQAQLADYRNIFDRIYIVTQPKNAGDVLDLIDAPIGIMLLTDGGKLDEIREAQSNKTNADPAAIFDCMRKAEYCSALREVYGYVPDVPNSKLYVESKRLFSQIDPSDAHDLMVKQVRFRGKQKIYADLVNEAPHSLKHACLSFSKSQALAFQIKERLNEPLLA